jgi:hypothetical protein
MKTTPVPLVALLLGAGCGSSVVPDTSMPYTPSPRDLVATAILRDANAGRFQAPPKGHHYTRPVDCRVDKPHGFHGQAIYLCKISISNIPDAHLYEWGAWQGGRLHTHGTNPSLIQTITGPFDPPF